MAFLFVTSSRIDCSDIKIEMAPPPIQLCAVEKATRSLPLQPLTSSRMGLKSWALSRSQAHVDRSRCISILHCATHF